MALDAERLLGLRSPPRITAYGERDVMLYALAVGAGAEGGHGDLDFVHEARLRVIPSFANVLAFDDQWPTSAGIDLRQVVHGALDLTFHAPLATEGEAETDVRVAGLVDKGEGRGGIIVQAAVLRQNGHDVCTSLSSLFVRGGGGFGGSTGIDTPRVTLPERPADMTLQVPTARNQALLFRLLGDRNPLHVDPVTARQSGFDQPILHGACTFGMACLTVIRRFCDGNPDRLTRFAARFAGPLVPGEALDFSFWREADRVVFRADTTDRGTPVLDQGVAALAN